MKDLLMFIRRFARPYKWNVVWSVVFNFLTMFATIFSFAFIMPILKILFKLDTTEYVYMHIGDDNIQDVAINNFYWYVTHLISKFGEIGFFTNADRLDATDTSISVTSPDILDIMSPFLSFV